MKLKNCVIGTEVQIKTLMYHLLSVASVHHVNTVLSRRTSVLSMQYLMRMGM